MEHTLRVGRPGTAGGRGIDVVFPLAVAIFFVSGASSLVYQVIWVRMLSLFFGSDVYAAAITLSVFMGGLAFGSWLSGRLADRAALLFADRRFTGLRTVVRVQGAACSYAHRHEQESDRARAHDYSVGFFSV